MGTRKKDIAALNDRFRRTFTGGKVVLTSGIASMSEEQVRAILRALRTFEEFEPGDDPYGEHDFGALSVNGHRVFWKIDYYDAELSGGSEDPSDPAVTTRVLTIMLAEEY